MYDTYCGVINHNRTYYTEFNEHRKVNKSRFFKSRHGMAFTTLCV